MFVWYAREKQEKQENKKTGNRAGGGRGYADEPARACHGVAEGEAGNFALPVGDAKVAIRGQLATNWPKMASA